MACTSCASSDCVHQQRDSLLCQSVGVRLRGHNISAAYDMMTRRRVNSAGGKRDGQPDGHRQPVVSAGAGRLGGGGPAADAAGGRQKGEGALRADVLCCVKTLPAVAGRCTCICCVHLLAPASPHRYVCNYIRSMLSNLTGT